MSINLSIETEGEEEYLMLPPSKFLISNKKSDDPTVLISSNEIERIFIKAEISNQGIVIVDYIGKNAMINNQEISRGSIWNIDDQLIIGTSKITCKYSGIPIGFAEKRTVLNDSAIMHATAVKKKSKREEKRAVWFFVMTSILVCFIISLIIGFR